MRLIDADALKEAAQTVRETTDAFCELIDAQETMDISTMIIKEKLKAQETSIRMVEDAMRAMAEYSPTRDDEDEEDY